MTEIPSRRSQQRQGLVLAAMTLANAMVLVDQTAVPLTLADIMRRFEVGSQLVQWVLTGSLLTLAALLVLGGQLGDLLGRRRVLALGTVVFAGASACAAFAPTFGMLILFRAVQGVGGALMLPTTVALVSATYVGRQRGSALGLMGGLAAVAGAGGPVIGGLLTANLGWPAVFLINVPLAAVVLVITLTAVPADHRGQVSGRIDLAGAGLLAVSMVALIVGLGQSQSWGWTSPAVWVMLAVAAGGTAAFLAVERRQKQPLVDFRLLASAPNYRAGVISQGLSGAAEMGLGIILPLLLILNLRMDPGLAGLALLPVSVPLIIIAPLVGRWYDRSGTRPPMLTGYVLLTASGLLLAWGGFTSNYFLLLPGLLLYGAALAIVLTVNDPVSLSDVPDRSHGEAAGVSATAEQFGGALGIAVLYLVFHTTYVARLYEIVDRGPLPDLDVSGWERLRADLLAAESTGLDVQRFDPTLSPYLLAARSAAATGYAAAFLGVSVLGILGCVLASRTKRGPTTDDTSAV